MPIAIGRSKDRYWMGAILTACFYAHSPQFPLGVGLRQRPSYGSPYKGSGFVLRIGGSIASLINSFEDPDQDLLHIDLEKTTNGDNYQARVTRLVGGFDSPIDAEIVDNRIYVIEWGNTRGLWEVILPAETRTAVVEIEGAGLPERSALSKTIPIHLIQTRPSNTVWIGPNLYQSGDL